MTPRRSLFRSSTLLAVALALHGAVGSAGVYSDSLGKALVAASTPAEKVALVRWIFVAMSLHPGVKDLASVSPQQRLEANQAVGKLFTRLLTEACATEAREAIRYEGTSALSSSFQILGQVAAREIFGDREVNAGLADLEKFIEVEKIKKMLEGNAEPAPGARP